MKNMLATVQSIVNQSMRPDQPVDGIRTNITERLDALARSHDVLQGREFDTASIRAVVQQAIAPFNSAGRIHFFGQELQISHQASSSLALALHELATNAVKYGALSNESGRVRIEWHVEGDAFRFSWTETAGPPVVKPERSGFGTRLIRMLGMSLQGKAEIDYRPGGVVFTA